MATTGQKQRQRRERKEIVSYTVAPAVAEGVRIVAAEDGISGSALANFALGVAVALAPEAEARGCTVIELLRAIVQGVKAQRQAAE